MKKYATVAFEDNQGNQRDEVYLYLVDIENLKSGDYVVVETRKTYSVARFIAYTNRNTLSRDITKWVVQKLDMKAHKKRKDKFQEFSEVREKMMERVEELEELKLFESLSEKDKEMKQLLKKYKNYTA